MEISAMPYKGRLKVGVKKEIRALTWMIWVLGAIRFAYEALVPTASEKGVWIFLPVMALLLEYYHLHCTFEISDKGLWWPSGFLVRRRFIAWDDISSFRKEILNAGDGYVYPIVIVTKGRKITISHNSKILRKEDVKLAMEFFTFKVGSSKLLRQRKVRKSKVRRSA